MRMIFLGAVPLVATLLGQSSAFGQETRDSSNTSSVEITTKTVQLIEEKSAVVKFAPGSSDLVTAEMDKLRTLVEGAKKGAPIDKFIVAAWADKDYPAEGAELSAADRSLADKRASAVKAALKNLRAGSVDTYSMAMHPNWLSRAFGLESSSIKTGGGMTTDKNQVATQIGQKLRSKGGPGTAVVVVRYENQVSSH